MAAYIYFRDPVDPNLDTFDFQPQLTTEPTAPEPYMQWKLNNAIVTNYQYSGSSGDLLMNADLLATPGPDVNDSSTNPSNGQVVMAALPTVTTTAVCCCLTEQAAARAIAPGQCNVASAARSASASVCDSRMNFGPT